jgi:hypothetical protein
MRKGGAAARSSGQAGISDRHMFWAELNFTFRFDNLPWAWQILCVLVSANKTNGIHDTCRYST